MREQVQGNEVKVWINGLSGRMGQILKDQVVADKSFSFISGASVDYFDLEVQKLDKTELVIDFSSVDGSHALASYVNEQKSLPKQSYLICTTGLSHDTTALWKSIAEKGHRVLLAANTSLGIYLTLQSALKIAPVAKSEGFDLVIEDSHHRYKVDSPSGTALFLANELAAQNKLTVKTEAGQAWSAESLPVTAVRGGGIFGEHTIRMIGDHEEISITHRAFSRELFAKGALFLGRWLSSQKSGFYSLNDVSF